MISVHDTGADVFLADLDAQVPTQRSHALTLENSADYAPAMEDRLGFFVFNVDHAGETVVGKLQEVIDAGLPLSDENIERALDAAGFAEIDWLRSHTDQMRPPVKAGGPLRPAHPGGWADVKGQLANAYGHRVDDGPFKTGGGEG